MAAFGPRGNGPIGLIGQEGEVPKDGYVVLAEQEVKGVEFERFADLKPGWSEETAALVSSLTAMRDAQISS